MALCTQSQPLTLSTPYHSNSAIKDFDKYISLQKQMIHLEHNYETMELESSNNPITSNSQLSKLSILDVTSGLFNRYILKFGNLAFNKKNKKAKNFQQNLKPLPNHKLNLGDCVRINCTNTVILNSKFNSAIVHNITNFSISLILEEKNYTQIFSLNETTSKLTFTLKLLPNDITYKRYMSSLKLMEEMYYKASLNALQRFLIDGEDLRMHDTHIKQESRLEFEEVSYLNDVQNEAVRFASEPQRKLALIHGPPGTGKTTVLVETIRQIFNQNSRQRLIVCAPSNVAVDNLVEKLSNIRLPNIHIVRIGHPSRMSNSILKYSLDSLIENTSHSQYTEVISDIKSEIKKSLSKSSSNFRELHGLRKELTKYQRIAIDSILLGSGSEKPTQCTQGLIVLTTLTTSACSTLIERFDNFDVCIIDEAAQALEIASQIPILRSSKLILAGDHCQLPPTVLSIEAARLGLDQSLFDRVLRMVKPDNQNFIRMLTIQYRMNVSIMNQSSEEFYQGRLCAHPSVENSSLSDLRTDKDGSDDGFKKGSLVFIDTSYCQMNEQIQKNNSSFLNGGSYINLDEALIAIEYLEKLLRNFSSLKLEECAIITPYRAQATLIREILRSKTQSQSSAVQKHFESLEIGTVDGFQGREKEVIIITFVRSNFEGQVGFLSNERRTNVAITRAKRHCVLIMDTATLSRSSKFFQRLIDYCHENADIVCVDEFDIKEKSANFDFKKFNISSSSNTKNKPSTTLKQISTSKISNKPKNTNINLFYERKPMLDKGKIQPSYKFRQVVHDYSKNRFCIDDEDESNESTSSDSSEDLVVDIDKCKDNKEFQKCFKKDKQEEEDDFDKFLQDFSSEFSTCNFSQCNKRLNISNHDTCRHCRLPFCFEHINREFHKCSSNVLNKAGIAGSKGRNRSQQQKLSAKILEKKKQRLPKQKKKKKK